MLFLTGLVLLFPLVFAGNGTCYWPNGDQATTDVVCPSRSDPNHSACCFTNHYCLENGLCYEPVTMTMYRGGCTDQQWNSTSCPQFCLTISDDECGVMSCNYGLVACYGGDCTDNFTISAGTLQYNEAAASDMGVLASSTARQAAVTITMSPSSSGTVTAKETVPGSESTSATRAASSSQSSTSSDENISPGAAAGIGIGVGVPLALAVGVLIMILIRNKKRQKTYQEARDLSGELQGTALWRLKSTEQLPPSVQRAPQPVHLSPSGALPSSPAPPAPPAPLEMMAYEPSELFGTSVPATRLHRNTHLTDIIVGEQLGHLQTMPVTGDPQYSFNVLQGR